MILQASEFPVIKAALALLHAHSDTNVVLQLRRVGAPGYKGPVVTLDMSSAGILIKAEFCDAGPAVEFYRWPAGLAQAYGISIVRITNQDEGD